MRDKARPTLPLRIFSGGRVAEVAVALLLTITALAMLLGTVADKMADGDASPSRSASSMQLPR
ncbi:MAG: hypothetical protein VX871_10365 [Pseudomonadota bacterium]|nr:hypothetical protein [Pseudomonadota bacterium]